MAKEKITEQILNEIREYRNEELRANRDNSVFYILLSILYYILSSLMKNPELFLRFKNINFTLMKNKIIRIL